MSVRNKQEMIKIGEEMVEQVVFALARGGYNKQLGDKRKEYRLRKERDGWSAWHNLGKSRQVMMVVDRIVECECVEDGKSFMFCSMCEGDGKRKMTQKEKKAFKNAIRMKDDRERYERAGNESCVNYVMDSTVLMASKGVWQEPFVTDGYSVNWWRKNSRERRIDVEVPVKMYHGVKYIGTETKKVSVIDMERKVLPEWKQLLGLLADRESDMRTEIKMLMEPRLIELKKRDINEVRLLSGKIFNYGECCMGEDLVRRHLSYDNFKKVEHLFA